MKLLELTLRSGKPITFLVSNTFCVYPSDDEGVGCRVNDGTHRKSGYPVKEKYEDVVTLLSLL